MTITKLSTGYFHIRGNGPCNWAQPSSWPCSAGEIRKSAFPEASETFIRSVMELSEKQTAKGLEGNETKTY